MLIYVRDMFGFLVAVESNSKSLYGKLGRCRGMYCCLVALMGAPMVRDGWSTPPGHIWGGLRKTNGSGKNFRWAWLNFTHLELDLKIRYGKLGPCRGWDKQMAQVRLLGRHDWTLLTFNSLALPSSKWVIVIDASSSTQYTLCPPFPIPMWISYSKETLKAFLAV